MDNLKKHIKNFDIGFLFGIGMVISGVILLLLPGSALTTVCSILGIGVAIKGGIKLFNYIKAKQVEAENNSDLISAIITLIGAFILISHPKKLLSIIPMLIGIAILIYGISSFFKANRLFSRITAIITAVVGFAIIGSPFAFAEAVTAILGVALIIVGIIMIIKAKDTITLKINGKDDDGYTEIEFKDVE